MVLHYRDDAGDMQVLSFVGLSAIMAHSVPSTFAFLEAMMIELHKTMPLLNIIHFVADWTVQVLSTKVAPLRVGWPGPADAYTK